MTWREENCRKEWTLYYTLVLSQDKTRQDQNSLLFHSLSEKPACVFLWAPPTRPPQRSPAKRARPVRVPCFDIRSHTAVYRFSSVTAKLSYFEPPSCLLFVHPFQLCDFGLARSLGKAQSAATSPGGGSSAGGVAPDVEDGDSGGEAKLTEYVVTRWWRAPEVRGGRERERACVWERGLLFLF